MRNEPDEGEDVKTTRHYGDEPRWQRRRDGKRDQ